MNHMEEEQCKTKAGNNWQLSVFINKIKKQQHTGMTIGHTTVCTPIEGKCNRLTQICLVM